ncbi:3-oxoacyl-[acyl-carrier-protein] synthase 3 protein 1 [Phycisphaerae bacterium RAS1]|nr:3-oxoacyl-[acyl-carrier-protein] synthase 3 protein 1 [Phycisphaerae bacterium RAS1]
MQFSHVRIDAIAYELAPHVISSAALEDRIAPVYAALRIPPGQIEPLTGIRERRFWPAGFQVTDGAIAAGRKALAASAAPAAELGAVIYAGVCRDNLEPASACRVADALGVSPRTQVYDISNACLGVLNGIVQIANAIELGQMTAGLVVSCESARQIVDLMIERLVAEPTMERFKTTLATLTGGSGAIAVLLCDARRRPGGRRLVGGVARSATQHHGLCRWGPDSGIPATSPQVMETHAIEVLENGVKLGVATWRDFLPTIGWAGGHLGDRPPAGLAAERSDGPDRVICHQVGAANRDAILTALSLAPEKDFSTFRYLGNIGTVSLPITAAIAEERGFLQAGQRVGFLGIGSGLNCIMLGVEW